MVQMCRDNVELLLEFANVRVSSTQVFLSAMDVDQTDSYSSPPSSSSSSSSSSSTNTEEATSTRILYVFRMDCTPQSQHLPDEVPPLYSNCDNTQVFLMCGADIVFPLASSVVTSKVHFASNQSSQYVFLLPSGTVHEIEIPAVATAAVDVDFDGQASKSLLALLEQLIRRYAVEWTSLNPDDDDNQNKPAFTSPSLDSSAIITSQPAFLFSGALESATNGILWISNSVASVLTGGANMLGDRVIKNGGSFAVRHLPSISSRTPNIPSNVKFAAETSRSATKQIVRLSASLVSFILDLAASLASRMVKFLSDTGFARRVFSLRLDKSGTTSAVLLANALDLFSVCVSAAGTVNSSIHKSANIIATDTRTAVHGVVHHTLGPDFGGISSSTLDMMVDFMDTYHNIDKLCSPSHMGTKLVRTVSQQLLHDSATIYSSKTQRPTQHRHPKTLREMETMAVRPLRVASCDELALLGKCIHDPSSSGSSSPTTRSLGSPQLVDV